MSTFLGSKSAFSLTYVGGRFALCSNNFSFKVGVQDIKFWICPKGVTKMWDKIIKKLRKKTKWKNVSERQVFYDKLHKIHLLDFIVYVNNYYKNIYEEKCLKLCI